MVDWFRKPQGLGMFGMGGQPETYQAMGGFGAAPAPMAAPGGGWQPHNLTLLYTGLGMMGGKNNREALAGGAHGLMMGMTAQQKQDEKNKQLMQEQAELEALDGMGLPESQLSLAKASALYRGKLYESQFREPKNMYTGTDFGVLNQQTGELRPFSGPQAKGKPPPGYEWLADGTLSAIPGGPATEMPAELAARLGMTENFLRGVKDGVGPNGQPVEGLRTKVDRGDVTGLWDVNVARYAGRGPQGEIYRQIESGVDALRRMLTGAGMPADEASDYVRRYMPTGRDDSVSMTSKLDALVSELGAMKASAERGRIPRKPQGSGWGGTTANGLGWSIEE